MALRYFRLADVATRFNSSSNSAYSAWISFSPTMIAPLVSAQPYEPSEGIRDVRFPSKTR